LNAPTPRRPVVALGGHAIPPRGAAGPSGGPATTATASVLVRDLLTGPLRPATVVANGRSATYLGVGERLVAVVAPGGVRLPCAILPTDGGPWRGGARPPGAQGWAVGGGAVHHDGRRIVVGRWFDPRVRVPAVPRAAGLRLAGLVRSRGRLDPLLPPDAVARLADGLAAGSARREVAALLGRGTGLTPAGDDLVAGALAALRALGSPAADTLGPAVRALAPVATTRLSAALLEAADLGAVIPEAAAVLRALAGVGALEAAVDRLVGVGHTSGWHLAAGLLVGVAQARRTADPVPA
jgi:hypothetical protein